MRAKKGESEGGNLEAEEEEEEEEEGMMIEEIDVCEAAIDIVVVLFFVLFA